MPQEKLERSERVTGFSHVGLTVQDIDRSLHFYRDLLGLSVRASWTRDEPYIRELLGFPSLVLRAVVLSVPNSASLIELVEYNNVERVPIDASHADPGTSHVSLLVDHLDAFAARLQRNGVDLVSEPVTPTVGPNRGGRAVYAIDPDGIRVELTETTRGLADHSE